MLFIIGLMQEPVWGSHTLKLMQGVDVSMEEADRDTIAPPTASGGEQEAPSRSHL